MVHTLILEFPLEIEVLVNMQAHDGTEGVKLFLQRLNLEQYLDIFIAKGFDREFDIPHISTEDLDSMKIKDSTHRELILKNGK